MENLDAEGRINPDQNYVILTNTDESSDTDDCLLMVKESIMEIFWNFTIKTLFYQFDINGGQMVITCRKLMTQDIELNDEISTTYRLQPRKSHKNLHFEVV